jgi:hypothetical protein
MTISVRVFRQIALDFFDKSLDLVQFREETYGKAETMAFLL